MTSCDKCGASFTRKFNLKRHQTSRCKGRMLTNTIGDGVVATVGENNHLRPEDSRLSPTPSFIDKIINNNPESENTMIQPLKSTPISYAEKLMVDPSLTIKKPAQEIMSVHETTKKLNIPECDESSDDESIVEQPSTKKLKLQSVADNISDAPEPDLHDISNDDNDNLSQQGSENHIIKQKGEDENADIGDYDIDNKNNDGNGNDSDEDESDCDKENISKQDLKARLQHSINNMKMFELNLDADRALTNIDLLEYIDLLKVSKFRGVFHRDALPKRVNPVECGIVKSLPTRTVGNSLGLLCEGS